MHMFPEPLVVGKQSSNSLINVAVVKRVIVHRV
jgi:hypothetical protein